MTQTIDGLDLVTHTCLVPDSAEHIREATAAWLAGGLAAGERVMYFEDESAGSVLERLADDRVAVDSALAGGQLVVVPTAETRAGADVPLDEVAGMFADLVTESTELGWPRLRINGDGARSILAGHGLDALVEYESIISRFTETHPLATVLCLYDRRIFGPEAIAAMRAAHRSELIDAAVYDDSLLRVTSAGPGHLRFAGELDHSNALVLRRLLDGSFDSALRSTEARPDLATDLSSLRFIDVGGASELVHMATDLPSTHRLVLMGVRPPLMRVLQRCDAGLVPQLRIEPHPDPTRVTS